MIFSDSGMQSFLSIADSKRAFSTLGKLALHELSRWVLVGGPVVEFQCRGSGHSHQIRDLSDIDFVVPSFEYIPTTLARDFLFRHIHPFDPPGKNMMQLIDADTSLRVDVFRAGGGIIRRAISVDVAFDPLRVISVEDVLAHEARLLLDLAAMAGSPEADSSDDIRRNEHISQSDDRNSSQPPDQSQLFQRRCRDLPPLCADSFIPVG